MKTRKNSRSQAEDSSRDDQRFRAVIDALPGALFGHDLDGRFVVVNEAASQHTGWSQKELLGMSVGDIDPDSISRHDREKLWQVLKEGASRVIASTHVRRDGTTYPAEIHLNAITLDNRPVILGVAYDITSRQKAEAALRQSEKRFRALAELLPEAVFEADENMELTYVNARALEVFGYLTSDFKKGMKAFDFIEPSDREQVQANMVRRLQGENPGLVEYRARKKDGTVFPILIHSNYQVEDGKFTGMRGIIIDISEQKKAEEELRTSRTMLETILKNMPGGMLIIGDDYRIYQVNKRTCEISGYTEEELVGQLCDIVCPKGSISKECPIWDKQESEFSGMDTAIKRKDGGRTPVLKNAQRISIGGKQYILENFQDITQRKQAEGALRESEARFRQVYENIAVGVARVSLDFRIENANEPYCRMLGYSGKELEGKHLRDITAPESLEENLEKQAQLGRGEIDHYRMEKQFVHKEGGTVHGLLDANLVRDRQGRPLYFLGTVVDITDRKKTEQEKQRLEEQIHQTQKLESIGRLAGGVAHDLNNILTPIIGYGEMLVQETGRNEEEREMLEEIVDSGVRARNLVRQLLAFSRKQALEFKPLSVNKLLDGIAKLIRRTIREDIEVKLIKAESLPLVLGDAGQMEQVIMNLVVNAQDAMPQGGKLTIETSRKQTEKPAGKDAAPEPQVVLSVSDTGCGIDDEIGPHIFEPFFTTKSNNTGTGLGLATVYGIVKQHSGHVRFCSEPGQGATFSVYLPASEAPAEPGDEQADFAAELGGSEKIVLVEDNKQVRAFSTAILQRHGYDVLPSSGGREALALAEKLETAPHLLLTDVVMPGLNGKELYERIAELHPGIKVLYMSGYTNDVIEQRGVSEGAYHFIQKPFSGPDLVAKVRETLDEPA